MWQYLLRVRHWQPSLFWDMVLLHVSYWEVLSWMGCLTLPEAFCICCDDPMFAFFSLSMWSAMVIDLWIRKLLIPEIKTRLVVLCDLLDVLLESFSAYSGENICSCVQNHVGLMRRVQQNSNPSIFWNDLRSVEISSTVSIACFITKSLFFFMFMIEVRGWWFQTHVDFWYRWGGSG